jgi:tripartite-type tricarboxylate transporter receptor subunit TctC
MPHERRDRRTTFLLQRTFMLCVAASAALTIASATAAYPERPIRLIVSSAPGGQPDINARMFAVELGKAFGQQVVVDNRSGATGVIGYEMLAKSAPDGHTMSYVAFSLATNPSLLPKLPYDLARDLQLVILTHISPNILTISSAMPIKSVAELISYAKQNPGKLMFGSGGNGASSHIGMELFMQMTGTRLLHVPYKGVQQAVTEIIGGRLQLLSDNASPMMPHIQSGRLRGLGVTGPRRIPLAPDLPTIAEAGVPGYEITPWGGYAVPAGTPKVVVMRLNSEFNKIVAMPYVRERWISVGIEPVGGTPEHFTEHVKKETVKWGEVIRRIGATGG